MSYGLWRLCLSVKLIAMQLRMKQRRVKGLNDLISIISIVVHNIYFIIITY